MASIDLELIKKYDKPGPRYTSYPTAPHFSDAFTQKDFLEEMDVTNAESMSPDLSLYYHLPFCDTLCYFCGCNMIVSKNRERINRYLQYLKKEIDLVSDRIAPGRKAAQLHWGGGTPTHLTPDEIADLSAHIRARFELRDPVEASCEIDPRELTRAHLEALRNGGFSRISMGVQDFNERVQKAVNRVQPEGLTRTVAQWVRELGFSGINLDLMYGLPFQSPQTFEKTVEAVIDISPDRIALFNFAYVPWMKKHMRAIRPETLPPAEMKLDILKMATEMLTRAGYVFIGMDHFSKPNDELAVALREKRLYRNFQGYSTHAGTDLYAMGITGISQFGRIYAQNAREEKPYFEALERDLVPVIKGCTLTDDDLLRRWVITRLMCDFELDFRAVEAEFDIDFESYFRWGLGNFQEMIADHLLSIEDRKLTVTEPGRLLIRNIAMSFDGYIERKEDAGRYSRTV